MNPYIDYYTNQAGSGISYFQGTRFQRGHGFFGRLFSNTILPVLKFLGKHALSTGINVASDALEGQNIKQSLKKRLVEQGITAGEQALNKAKMYAQTSQGFKHKKRRSRSKSKLRLKKRSKLAIENKTIKRKKSRKRRRKRKVKQLF